MVAERDFGLFWKRVKEVVGYQPQNKQVFSKEAKNLLSDLRYVKDRYGIRIKSGRINCDDDKDLRISRLYLQNARDAVAILKEELEKYPPSFIHSLGLKRVRFVKTITDIQKPKQARYYGGEAFTDGDTYMVFYPGFTDYFRGVIHHELQHQSDFHPSKNPVSGFWDSITTGIRWSGLNKFDYIGDKYWEGRHKFTEDGVTGFAKRYGQTSFLEDRATVTEILMTDPQSIFERCADDALLRKKVFLIMVDFERRSRGAMNKKFFNDLLQGNVGSGYWG